MMLFVTFGGLNDKCDGTSAPAVFRSFFIAFQDSDTPGKVVMIERGKGKKNGDWSRVRN